MIFSFMLNVLIQNGNSLTGFWFIDSNVNDFLREKDNAYFVYAFYSVKVLVPIKVIYY